MKKTTAMVMALVLVLGMLPLAFAEEADIGGTIVIDIPDGSGDSCIPPEIFVDPTARIWNPNDQTYYTAEEYGDPATNAYGDSGYEVPERQNYFFQGETLDFYIAVYDANGAEDITEANILLGGVAHGACAERDLIQDYQDENSASIGDARDYMTEHFSLDVALSSSTDDEYYKFFVCRLIVQAGWDSFEPVSVQATDGGEMICSSSPNTVQSTWSDYLDFNPTLALDLVGGPIDFGTVAAGETSTSNTVYLVNDAEAGSGVVMDMYIASDDYFTDPTNPSAICGEGNGIHYSRFSYYATKGTVNSGANDDSEPGLGVPEGTIDQYADEGYLCVAGTDEYTGLTSHSGHIEDMCRIINWGREASFLNQGAEMSLTFKLDVPPICQGDFTDGSFQFVGRVV